MRKKLFLHLGEIPVNGHSVCHTLTDGTWFYGSWFDLEEEDRLDFEKSGYYENGGIVFEPGLSVFGESHDSDVDDLKFDIAKSNITDVLEWVERPGYLIHGTKIGEGFDGEPLIKIINVVGKVKCFFDKRERVICIEYFYLS